MDALRRATRREHRQAAFIGKAYGGVIKPIMRSRPLGWITLLAIGVAMLGAVAMFPLEMVAFKMLPYDNKSELQVVIDMPEGTDLFATANLAHRLGDALKTVPEVTAFQTYVGTSSPFNFNGLVRHYYMRQEPWRADMAVQLIDKELRERSSHDIAMAVRSLLQPIGAAAHARLTIAEAPPGPPVLAPVVVELYGPTAETRREVARHILRVMERTPHVADVNTFMEAPHDQIEFHVDRQRAKMFGVSVEDINRELAMATGGFEVGALQQTHNLEQALIVLQVPLATRVNLGNLLVLPVRTQTGATVPLSELGRFEPQPVDPPIWHKDLRPLEYVTGDVIGRLGAPLYGMLAIDSALKGYVTPDGKTISGSYFSRPDNTSVSGFKWDGEWQVTYVTFRDMGIAFMAALVLIYILVVAEFRSFVLPLVIMAPIPLTMIGIVPGHWLLGADFTATSMIGFIALAGIIVRNSILLVEFARERVAEGISVPEAITLAGHVRLRPIMITALALVIGSMVLLTDPIFQGMAVSLLFGSLVATFLTLVVIPMGCVSARKYFLGRPPHGGAHPGGGAPQGGAPSPGGPTPPAGGGPSGAPPPGGPEPSAAPGRPSRLVRKAEAETTIAAAPSLGEETAAQRRPPRLARKSEGEPPAVAPSAPGEAAAPGRPRLIRKSEAETVAAPPEPNETTAAPRRPPRLARKSEGEPPAVAPSAPGEAAPRRSPRRAKSGERAQASEVSAPAADAEARPQSPQIRDSETVINDLEGDSG